MVVESDSAIVTGIRLFAREEFAPLAIRLDREPHSEEAIQEFIKRGCEIGLFSAFLPRRYGGTLSGLTSAMAMEELGAVCSGIASFIGAVGLGLAPVALSGDPRLHERYFPEVLEAEKSGRPALWAFSITEPEAGSDVEDSHGSKHAKLGTIAVRDGDDYVLNGRKVFCTLGNLAKYVTVFACVERPTIDTWTCFVVPTSSPGFRAARVEQKLGQRAAPAAEIVFDNVRVPAENRVGEEGQGWALNRQTLTISRPSVGAIGVGIARSAYEHALRYALQRRQGGKNLIDHQLTRYKLGRLDTDIEMARSIVHRAASAYPPQIRLASMAKVAGSDIAVRATSEAVQLYGGYGYMEDAPVEKLYRDAKVTQIYEGTNEMNLFAVMEENLAAEGYEAPSQ
jgi:alkylation response protein AidB-like acyl-CoA dehydrogenase